MVRPLVELNLAGRSSRVLSYDSTQGLLEGASLVLADAHTAGLLPLNGANSLILPSGEASKNWETLGSILGRAAELGLRRDSIILGIGGGMVCDLAAFAAALYMRGTRLVLVPTSLVAMADAAIGGKSAVDLGGLRNLAGTIYAADEVRIHTAFLASLPEREYRAGLAEVIRTALIAAPKVEQLLTGSREAFLAREPGLLEETVRRCVAAKASLVERDPFDKGPRHSLNLGHSFAHALESVRPELLHGEAVAWGIGRALELGVQLGLTDPDFAASTRKLLEDYGFALKFTGVDAPALLAALRLDKKGDRSGIRIVILRDACSVCYEVVDEVRLRAIIAAGLS